ncbi:Tripartite-type tricarboxylate transporter receptor subunit TctC OS=Castellaniella defragrans OX=75697 GN=HNR28_001854 PE=3 SV=1 [Castellaniella defragrans]
MRQTLASIFCVAALASGPMAAAQDNYPTKSITMIVPSEPGGATDVAARAINAELSKKLGQTVIIENRGGASGIIGTELAARAEPNGYTLLLAPPPPSVIVPQYRKTPYSIFKNFVPVTLIETAPQILIVNPKVPASSVKELIALARKDPKALSYGSAGYGSPSSLAGQMFNKVNGLKIAEVPFKGAGPSMTSLLGNHIQMTFAPITVALPYIKQGSVKALAVTSPKRSKAFPDVPTLIESGSNVEVTSFYGVLAPAGTPQPIVDKLQQSIAEVLKDPKVKGFFEDSGAEVGGDTPTDFGAFMHRQYNQYGDILRQLGIAKK